MRIHGFVTVSMLLAGCSSGPGSEPSSSHPSEPNAGTTARSAQPRAAADPSHTFGQPGAGTGRASAAGAAQVAGRAPANASFAFRGATVVVHEGPSSQSLAFDVAGADGAHVGIASTNGEVTRQVDQYGRNLWRAAPPSPVDPWKSAGGGTSTGAGSGRHEEDNTYLYCVDQCASSCEESLYCTPTMEIVMPAYCEAMASGCVSNCAWMCAAWPLQCPPGYTQQGTTCVQSTITYCTSGCQPGWCGSTYDSCGNPEQCTDCGGSAGGGGTTGDECGSDTDCASGDCEFGICS